MTDKYILFGSYASYYTAKTRSYLRKKGIPFVQRLPSDPQFRERIRATSGSARIPQLLTPNGLVIQDTVTIFDYLEQRFPAFPAIPTSPKQRLFVHLMELLASEGLVKLAWMHRWIFEDNLQFVKMDFGRSFKPQGSDKDLLKYGNLIADRMMSHGLPEASEELKERIDSQYLSLLRLVETHLINHPYFLGGHPSAADYSIMGALHAHLGRDPAGLRMMQDNAPRVFRWVEHMIVPEIQSPEFFDRDIQYPADDQVPQTALDIMNFIANEFGESFLLGALAFNQAMAKRQPESGYQLNSDQDQPTLPTERVTYKDQEHEIRANLYSVWLTQRSQAFFQSLSPDDQTEIKQMLGEGIASKLISVPYKTKIARVNNRLVVA